MGDLDVILPGINGYEVVRTLRDDPCRRGCIVVAVSGCGECAARARSRESSFDHHLTNLLDFDQL